MNMLDNYPPGMSYDDLVHVGEYPEPPAPPLRCDYCGDEIMEHEKFHEEHGEIICDYCMKKIMAGE